MTAFSFHVIPASFYVTPASFHVIPAKAGIPLWRQASNRSIGHPKILQQSGVPAFAGMTVVKEGFGAGMRMIKHVLAPRQRGEDNRAMP